MSLAFLLPLIVLLVVVLAVIFIVQRLTGRRPAPPGSGDVLAYLLLALAVGVVGFALAELLGTAFPGERFVFDPAEELANSLSALVVAGPFAFYLWRRQAERRRQRPEAVGWVIYLAVIELVFLTALIIAAVALLDGLFNRGSLSSWPQLVVFAAMVAFHEVAATSTPPRSDGAELPRVVGSAIGWTTAVIGLAGVLGAGLFTYLYGTLVEAGSPTWHPFLSMAIVGLPIWAYRWLRPWPGRTGLLRGVWATVVSVASLVSAIGSATAVGALLIEYLLGPDDAVGSELDPIPILLGVSVVGLVSWLEHRRRLGADRSGPLPWYEYALAAFGLSGSVGLAFVLTMLVFDRPEIVGGGTGDILAIAFALVVALVVWRYFDRRWLSGEVEMETAGWPRRLYTLGLGIVFGLSAAGGLIATLFILLRRFLDGEGGSLLEPFSTLLYAGLAAWYLLASYRRDRDVVDDEEVISPFEVTLIASHPGMIATKFPKQAKLNVIHRGDDLGIVDEAMGEAIVSEVGNRSSLVWVDRDGFRVAPKRQS